MYNRDNPPIYIKILAYFFLFISFFFLLLTVVLFIKAAISYSYEGSQISNIYLSSAFPIAIITISVFLSAYLLYPKVIKKRIKREKHETPMGLDEIL